MIDALKFANFDESDSPLIRAVEVARRFLGRMKLRAPVYGRVKMNHEILFDGTVMLIAEAWVPSRDDPRTEVIVRSTMNVHLSALVGKSSRDIEEWILRSYRQVLRDMVTHEVDEMIDLDGALPFDPHRH